MKHKILSYLLILTLIPVLQGCAVLLGAVGAGTAAYYVGKSVADRQDKSIKTESLVAIREEFEQKQQEEQTQDQGISGDINQRLVSGSIAPGFAVYPEVRNGVVILHGRVPSGDAAQKVIQATRATPGVTRIISNLVVVNQQAQQATAATEAMRRQQLLRQQQLRQQQLRQQQIRQQQLRQQQPMQQRMPQQQQPSSPANNNAYRPPPQQQSNLSSPNNLNGQRNNVPDINSSQRNNRKNNKPNNQRNNAPRVMSPEEMQRYSDADSSYIPLNSYNPTNNNRLQPAMQQQQPIQSGVPVVQDPYIINVPVPQPVDVDPQYRQPIETYSYEPEIPAVPMPGDLNNESIPVPTPDTVQDNDNAYELYYYY